MALVPSDLTARLVEENTGLSTDHSRWTPLWLQRRRETEKLEHWASEVTWQWSHTMDGAQLSQPSVTAGGIRHNVTPQVHSVDPGPPVTLLVRMLAGQVAEDFQTQANRIAEGMGVPMVRVEHFDTGWINVILLVNDPQPTVTPLPE